MVITAGHNCCGVVVLPSSVAIMISNSNDFSITFYLIFSMTLLMNMLFSCKLPVLYGHNHNVTKEAQFLIVPCQ